MLAVADAALAGVTSVASATGDLDHYTCVVKSSADPSFSDWIGRGASCGRGEAAAGRPSSARTMSDLLVSTGWAPDVTLLVI